MCEARGRRQCVWLARNRLSQPSPANANELWPLGYERQPSCRRCGLVSVQTAMVTSLLCGVDGSGLQRAIKSGLGRPIAFLKMSVRREVVRRERTRPRRRTWVLLAERVGRMREATSRIAAGMARAWTKSIAGKGNTVSGCSYVANRVIEGAKTYGQAPVRSRREGVECADRRL